MIDLDALGNDLTLAYRRRVKGQKRRRRSIRTGGLAFLLAGAGSAVAIASGVGPDLQLDPTKWAILGGGSVDNGRGSYVHARNLQDDSSSTFMFEHDAGLDPYQAFLLHQRTRAAADASSPVPVRAERGEVCTAAELTRAETVALQTLHNSFPPATAPRATKEVVDAAVAAAFADASCRGLEYAGERARFVYAGVEPRSLLLPGAR